MITSDKIELGEDGETVNSRRLMVEERRGIKGRGRTKGTIMEGQGTKIGLEWRDKSKKKKNYN